MLDQWTWIAKRMDLISCSRLAYVSEEEVQHLILETIRSIRGTQFWCVCLELISGTHSYVTGRFPELIFNQSLMACPSSLSTPDKNTKLLSWFICSLDLLEKSSRLPRMIETEAKLGLHCRKSSNHHQSSDGLYHSVCTSSRT